MNQPFNYLRDTLYFRVKMKSLWICPTIAISRKIFFFFLYLQFKFAEAAFLTDDWMRDVHFSRIIWPVSSLSVFSPHGFRGNSSWERCLPLSPLPSHPSSLILCLPWILLAFFVHTSLPYLSAMPKPLFAEARKNDFVSLESFLVFINFSNFINHHKIICMFKYAIRYRV